MPQTLNNIQIESENIEITSKNINEPYGDDGSSFLFHAIRNQNIELVKLLLKNGANVNLKYLRRKHTALHEVCRSVYYYKVREPKNLEIANLLIEHNADVNAPDEYGYIE